MRRGKAAAVAAAANEDSDDAERLAPLKLSLSKAELVSRLKDLSQHLRLVGQDDDRAHLKSFTTTLAQTGYTDHRDRDVKLWVAICLADVLWIYAPDSPYTNPQLMKMFRLFVTQLQYITDDRHRNFEHVKYLLQKLAEVKAFLECQNLGADEVILSVFNRVFDSVREGHTADVKKQLETILCDLIMNADHLGTDILDTLLGQLIAKANPAATEIAESLLQRCSRHLQSHVYDFFRGLFGFKSSESDLKDHAFVLVEEICRVEPTVLLTTLPMVAQLLDPEHNVEERGQTVNLFGNIFSTCGGALIELHAPLWREFASTMNDPAPQVRTAALDYAPALLAFHDCGTVNTDIVEALATRLLDLVDVVRAHAVKVTVKALMQHPHLRENATLMEAVIGRLLDKKEVVSTTAYESLGRFYDHMASRFDDGDRMQPSGGGWWHVVGVRMIRYGTRFHACSAALASALSTTILRPSLEPRHRTLRLLRLFAALQHTDRDQADNASHATPSWTKHVVFPEKFRRFIRNSFAVIASEDGAGIAATAADSPRMGLSSERPSSRGSPRKDRALDLPGLTTAVTRILPVLPSGKKAGMGQALRELLLDAERRDAILDVLAADDAADGKASAEAEKAVLTGLKPTMHVAATGLLARAKPLIDVDMVGYALNELVEDEDTDSNGWSDGQGLHDAILIFLKACAATSPELFTSDDVVHHIFKLLGHSEYAGIGVQLLRLLPDVSSDVSTSRTKKRLVELAAGGHDLNPTAAADVVGVVLKLYGSQSRPVKALLSRYVSTLQNVHHHFDAGEGMLVRTALVGLRTIYCNAAGVVEAEAPGLIQVVVDALMLRDFDPAPKDEPEDAPEWIEEESDECAAKVLFIELLVERLLAMDTAQHQLEGRGLSQEEAEAAGRPTVGMLSAIIKDNGSISTGDTSTRAEVCSRVRLAATQGLLDLCARPGLCSYVYKDWGRWLMMAFVIEDSCIEVRSQVADRIYTLAIKPLRRSLLSERYSGPEAVLPPCSVLPLVLAAQDPIPDVAKKAQRYLNELSEVYATTGPYRGPQFLEQNAPFLVHLLAHRVDFNTEEIGTFDGSELTESQVEVLQENEIYFESFLRAVDRKKTKRNAPFPGILCAALMKSFWETRHCRDLMARDSSAVQVLAELGFRMATLRHKEGYTLEKVENKLSPRLPTMILKKAVRAQQLIPKEYRIGMRAGGHSYPGAAAQGSPQKTTTHAPRKSSSSGHKAKRARRSKTPKQPTTPTRVNKSRSAKAATGSYRESDMSEEEEHSEDSRVSAAAAAAAAASPAAHLDWRPVTAAKGSSTPVQSDTTVSPRRLREVTNTDSVVSDGERLRKRKSKSEIVESDCDEEDAAVESIKPASKKIIVRRGNRRSTRSGR